MIDNDPLSLRIYRAQSWLNKASSSDSDDIRFIALWIAFNAAYARELPGRRLMDKQEFSFFIHQICSLDKAQKLYRLVWQNFSQSIRILLDNQYVFQPFWDFQNGLISEPAWQEDFQKAKENVSKAVARQNTAKILLTIFERIYTLRNQIVHGGASFASSANRAQIRDACAILSALLPMVIEIIQNNPQYDWGKPFYPYLSGD